MANKIGDPQSKPKAVPRKTTSKKKRIEPAKPTPDEKRIWICTACGTGYDNLEKHFYASQSPFHRGWREDPEAINGRIPVCKKCIMHFERQYIDYLGSHDEAIKRLAMHFDMYFTESLLAASNKRRHNQTRIASYVGSMNMLQNAGRTWDTHLDEVAEAEAAIVTSEEDIAKVQEKEEFKGVTSDVVAFWGHGLPPEDYVFLQAQYDYTSISYKIRYVVYSPLHHESMQCICVNCWEPSQGPHYHPCTEK